MRNLASKFASALLIPTALLLASASPALALQVVEGSDGVSVDAVLSIKEATRIRVDGAPTGVHPGALPHAAPVP